MNTPLNPGELICFGFSHFDCEAKRLSSGRHQEHMGVYDEVRVTVRMFRGVEQTMTCSSTLTRAEIQELTAFRIIDKLRQVEVEVRGYANKTRKRAEEANA